jgi:hypothetical protein
VLPGYLAWIIGGIPMVHATKGSVIYIIYVSAVSAALTAICWLTGEPTRWRWGDRDA